MKQYNKLHVEIINEICLNAISESEQRIFFDTILCRILECKRQIVIENCDHGNELD